MGNATNCEAGDDCRQHIEEFCESMEKDYIVNAGLSIYLEGKAVLWLVAFSMIADFTIAALIYFNKDLHVHPMRLFMLASMCEASYA